MCLCRASSSDHITVVFRFLDLLCLVVVRPILSIYPAYKAPKFATPTCILFQPFLGCTYVLNLVKINMCHLIINPLFFYIRCFPRLAEVAEFTPMWNFFGHIFTTACPCWTSSMVISSGSSRCFNRQNLQGSSWFEIRVFFNLICWRG